MTMLTKDIRQWNPFRELDEMSRRLSRFFPSIGDGGSEIFERADWSPTVNVRETKEAYEIEAELPQIRKEDIHVRVERGVLCIEGERKVRKEEKDERYHRIESAYGKFQRRFTLPDDAVGDKVDAKCADGVLTVRIPKSEVKELKAREVRVD